MPSRKKKEICDLKKNHTQSLFLLGFCLFLMTCSAGPNALSPLTKKEEKESFDALSDLTQSAFDLGQIDKAIIYGEKAIAMDPRSERVSLLLAYSYLNKAGLNLEEAMNKFQNNNASKEQDSTTSFQTIVALEKTDYAYLGTIKDDDPSLPLVVPFCAKRARDSLGRLVWLQKAVARICPFIRPDLKHPSDGRHRCKLFIDEAEEIGDMEMPWLLAHLTESMIFYAVLDYKSSSSAKQTNLEQRVNKLKLYDLKNPLDIPNFLTDFTSVNEAVDAIFPTSLVCSFSMPDSQFMATVKDLDTVNKAVKAITFLPENIVKNLNDTLSSISSVNSSTDDIADLKSKADAVKSSATSQILSTLTQKLSDANPNSFTPEQKARICDTYQNLTKSNPQSTTPALCN